MANLTQNARPHHNTHRSSSWRVLAAASVFVFLTACQSSSLQTNRTASVTGEGISQDIILSDGLASNYLMARQAVYGNDLPAATDFYTKSLIFDDNNVVLLRHSFITHYQSGNINEAAEIARRMESLNYTMPLAQEPALIASALSEDWDAVAALSDILSQSDTSLIVAGVARAWALFAQDQFAGAVGQMAETAQLLKDEKGTIPAFMELQMAHLLEAAGKNIDALSILDDMRMIETLPPHIQLSIASAYHRLGQQQKARQIISDNLSPSFDVKDILSRFDDGSNALLQKMTIRRGLAQSLLDTSWLDTEKTIRSLLLARAQLALILDPDFEAAHFVIAQEYLAIDQLEPALRHLNAIQDHNAYYLPSQLVYMSYLRRIDEVDKALAHVRMLRTTRPDNARLILVESDILRSIDRCAEAVPLYETLLNSAFDTSRLHRNLAICLERTATTKEQEEIAEQYFLSSLDRDPNDAFTLNYLGYWYADTNRNLDDAITYIQRAVELRPSSGFFADSLGWVYYRLHDYDQAVIWLEKAIQLEPLDAIITEHLGDVYWTVGRFYEAKYKWELARQQTDEADMLRRLEGKLKEADKDNGTPLLSYPYRN